MKSLKQSLPLILVLATGCSDNLALKTGRWSQEGPAPSRPASLDKKAEALTVGSRKVLFQSQQIDGVEVEGAYYKEISSKTPEFITYKWAQPLPMNLRANLLLMKAHKRSVEEDFFNKHPEYHAKDLVGSPELVIQDDGPKWKFIFQIFDGRLEGVYVDRSMHIRSRQNLGSGFAKASATLFPSGPLKSRLEKVMLENLTDPQSLISNSVRILTQSDVKAQAENSQFAYPVDDRRFEQVQAYFYLSQAVDWVKKSLSFQMPFLLEAETSVGFPEKTNTAFYYQRRVRLGDGDDVVFSHIPLDPSVVMHESFHGVVEAVAKLPYEGEGGSLNEAFADFFTSVILDNPNMGEASYKKAPFKRTVNNSLKLGDQNGGLYHDSGIVSGLLWNVKKSLGSDLSVQLAWNTLLRLTPDSHFEEFKTELLDVLSKMPEDQQVKIRSILQQRGWLE